MTRSRRSTSPQPRTDAGLPGAGQWDRKGWSEPEPETELSDREAAMSMYAPLDAFTIEDGQIVDYEPEDGGSQFNAYLALASHGYDAL